ncbi:MAG TPA: branched-chain amino acid ABC transporter permease [Candidatus Cybelea sp.]|nr:branched-chain amino acid ABC transporter permease [Candidatus Cybelea sp.]
MLDYLLTLMTFGGIYALLALGLNLTWGLAGLVNLGLAGFYAVGAYGSAILTKHAAWPIAGGLAAAFVLAAAAGAVLAAITLRLRGDYLAIVTLGFAESMRLVASNEVWLTNGTDGISGVPGPWRGVVSPSDFDLLFAAGTLAAVAVALLFLERVRRSPYGRVLRAIRDDDTVAAVAGKPVARFKVEAFALGAGIMGVAGALYGHYTSYVAPDVFQPLITIYIFLALTAGGTGNNYGAVLGAALVIVLVEATRFAAAIMPGLAAVQVAALREIMIGLALILAMRFRPLGLIPEPRTKLSRLRTTKDKTP